MKITIEIEGNKAVMTTEVNGEKIEVGMKKDGPGLWSQCTENNIDDYDDSILSDEQYEALDAIDLSGLQEAFGEE